MRVPNADMVVRGVDKNYDSNNAFIVSKYSERKNDVSYSRLKELLLRQAQWRRLCVCGNSPDGCIQETVRYANENGYCRGDAVIINDAFYTTTREARNNNNGDDDDNTPFLIFKPLCELLFLWDVPILEG
jgi:hypothetical protein